MTNRFDRHDIVGDETDRPRPMAYLRAGWRMRRFSGRRSPSRLLRVGLAGALAVLALLWLAGWR